MYKCDFIYKWNLSKSYYFDMNFFTLIVLHDVDIR